MSKKQGLLDKHVRFKRDHLDRIGYVIGKAHGLSGWWVVEWPDGSQKKYPTRHLIMVKPPTK